MYYRRHLPKHSASIHQKNSLIGWLSRKKRPSCLVFVLLFLVLAPTSKVLSQPPLFKVQSAAGITPSLHAQSNTFVFAAGGDIGANRRADASLQAIPSTGAAFFLALGDMDYDETPSDAAWCDYVKGHVGATFPFELVTGNHEEGSPSNDGPDGYIGNHAACLPDYFGSNPVIPGAPAYPANYYFDYPQPSPIMRIIMISADLEFDGVKYEFNTSEQTNYNALAAKIDEAKQAGMWVVVGDHKNCITAGIKPCEIGADLMNLLIQKRVDLVLQGHDHTYQRSKQIALANTCASVVPESYNSSCVADDGSDNTYTRGAGTVFVISGTVGRCCNDVNTNDSEAGYFAKMVGLDGDNTNGFVKYSVSPSRIDAQVVNSVGSWGDSFALVGDESQRLPPTPVEPGESTTINPPTFIWNPAQEAVGYEIQYGDTNPPTTTAAVSATTFTPPKPLLIKTYFWRLRSQFDDQGYSDWSPTQSVRIESTVSAAPSHNFYSTTSLTLTWNRITWAIEYEVQVDTVSAFTLPLSFTAVVLGNTLGLPVAGLADGQYYWRVRGRRSNGTWASWSAVNSFVMDVP